MTQGLPSSRDCFVCGVSNPRGLRLKYHREGDRVFARVTLPAWAVGFRGVAHGGLVATLLDDAMGWAANCRAKGPTATGEMTVRYRQPTPVEEELLLEARAVKWRGPLVLVEASLCRADGAVLATSTGKLMRLPVDGPDDGAYELIYEPGDARIFEED